MQNVCGPIMVVHWTCEQSNSVLPVVFNLLILDFRTFFVNSVFIKVPHRDVHPWLTIYKKKKTEKKTHLTLNETRCSDVEWL